MTGRKNKTYLVRYKDGVEELWERVNLSGLKKDLEAFGSKSWKYGIRLIAEVKYEDWDDERDN